MAPGLYSDSLDTSGRCAAVPKHMAASLRISFRSDTLHAGVGGGGGEGRGREGEMKWRGGKGRMGLP